MPISSRTPEGDPFQCPVCGSLTSLEISDPPGDTLCPSCGQLLWKLRDRLEIPVDLDALLRDLPIDSMDFVELVMELEEETGVTLPDEELSQISTVAELIQLMRRKMGGEL